VDKYSCKAFDSFILANNSVRAFIDAMESGRYFTLRGTEARKAVELIPAIYKAAKERNPVKLR
jgi:hypothetical protein